LFDTPCPVCQGSGTERRVRSIKVRIPAGVEDGQRIRVKGRGAPGQGMAPPGDLYVVVHVGKHALFGRTGRNLTITVPVTYPEAVLGTQVTVPTLDGKVTLKVPAGTQSGKVLRVRGRGVPAGGRNGAKPGDLLVKIEVVVPTELTDEQRAAVESLAAVTDDAPRVAVEGAGAGAG
jgi:molecular chaperone DnaJ